MSLRQRLATITRHNPKLLVIPYYIYRFIQPKYSIGVIGVVFNEEHDVLLVEHVFHPSIPWGLPGGWIGNNEDPAATIKRELVEELSLHVEIKHVLLTRRTQFNHLDMAYLCQAQGNVGQLSYELLDYRWCAIDNLPQLHQFHHDAIMTAYQLLNKA